MKAEHELYILHLKAASVLSHIRTLNEQTSQNNHNEDTEKMKAEEMKRYKSIMEKIDVIRLINQN